MTIRVKFDVGGQIYGISLAALQNGPSSRLTQMCTTGRTLSESTYIEIDRPADMFASVLALYQTGELHFPMTSCPGAFLRELEFWDIAPEVVSSCCYERLQSFIVDQNMLKQFRESREVFQKRSHYPDNFAKSFQGRLWNIIDFSKPSILGKIYFVISLSMVLLSISTLAFSTDPYFRRKMTNCERLEYMKSSGIEHFELAKKWLIRDCENEAYPNHQNPLDVTRQNADIDNDCRTPIFTRFEKYHTVYLSYDNDIDHGYGFDEPNSTITNGQDNSNLTQLFTESILSSVNSLQNHTEATTVADNMFKDSNTPRNNGNKPRKNKGEFVELPVFEIQIYAFVILDTVTVVYFTIDLLLRLIFCPSRKYYFFSIINFIDVLALVATYIHIVLMQAFKHQKYRDNWMDILKYFQVLRSLRLFRTVSNVRAGQVLSYTVRENFKDIFVLVFFLVVGVSSFASCMFVAEEREDIQSIPIGWYWALVTMTTVGYGDITPKSAVGKVISCLCAFAGIILLALTVPIFANNFLTLYKFANSEKAIQKYKQNNSKIVKKDTKIPEKYRFNGTGDEIKFNYVNTKE